MEQFVYHNLAFKLIFIQFADTWHVFHSAWYQLLPDSTRPMIISLLFNWYARAVRAALSPSGALGKPISWCPPSSYNRCGSGHRKLRVCVVKNPLCSSFFSSFSLSSSSCYGLPPLFPPHPLPPFSSLPRLIFVIYSTLRPSSLLYNHIDRQTDQPTKADKENETKIDRINLGAIQNWFGLWIVSTQKCYSFS